MRKFTTAALASAALAFTLPATPAFAQGSVGPTPEIGRSCPSGYSDGGGRASTSADMCYPSSSAPAVYANPSRAKCAAGYFTDKSWCTNKPTSVSVVETVSGKIAKSDPLDRCPATFYSEPDLKTCISIASSPPPTRAKGAGACRAGELEEWGKWCTTNNGKMAEGDVTQGHYRDVNTIYQFSGSKTPNGGADVYNTPTIRALFRGGAGAGGSASATPASSNQQSASNDAPAANCTTTSATGSAIGGMLGGQAGAALGGMLGGKSKKKKNGC